MKISFVEPKGPAKDSSVGAVAVIATPDKKLPPTAAAIDKSLSGALTRAIAGSKFTGKPGQSINLLAPARSKAHRIIACGIGEAKKAQSRTFEDLGGKLVADLNGAGEKEAVIWVDGVEDAAEAAARIAYGARLRSYRFDKYRTKEPKEKKPSLRRLSVAVPGAAQARKLFAPLDKIAEGVFFTRDLVSEPANVLFPAEFANRTKALEELGVKVKILGEKELNKLGMRALLGVGQGSVRESQLVVMQWNGGQPKEAPVAFVGKGVCFDTGGISIKPAPGMEDMKWDMGGAGVVTGLMMALAGRKAAVNAVGVIGLVENMPGGNAQRPGDIVASMSEQTIEVLNTDAEGRLVLADALWYTQKEFKPKFMVDLATLTGAIIIALGGEHAGLFSDSDDLSEQLTAAGLAVNEKVWRLPLHENYDKELDCDAADVKNIGGGRSAGSITAAQFLKRFTNNVPWAHLDIAGVTWSKKDASTVPKGGTGFGVRLLDRFVADNYED
ncbi:MAG: leucyl aminopeptidase [Alphaproteobacteria bacterium]|nr:leucyl aminopeptidase [Alphaproteobacteria bacterium]